MAKTANLLQDDLAVEPGERIALLLPLHWQSAVVALAGWSLGAVVTDAVEDAAVVFAAESRLDEAGSGTAREILGLALRPLGGRLATTHRGVLDYGVEVPSQGDRFTAYAPVDPDAPAVDLGVDPGGRTATGRELVDAAGAAASRWAVTAGDRVLTTAPLLTWDGLLAGLLVPLAAGAGAVFCRHADPLALPRRVRDERVTATVGVDVEGVRRLA